MLHYSDEKFKGQWKKFVTYVSKGLVLVGTAAWLCFSLGSAAGKVNAMWRSADVDSGAVHTVERPNSITVERQTAVEEQKLWADEEAVAADAPAEEPLFINPAAGVLTSGFGARWGRTHSGIDIGGDMNSDILAAADGVVTYADWMSGYGNYVMIDHHNGYQTAYGHCNSLLVSDGEQVTQGQLIAKMGSTGNSTGPHLHFEVKADNVFQDPLDYVMY